ncbi:MAG: SCP2 sterol-binding domain-containing protein [Lachnospiraceae bacterium]|nr:SCP2 sterol-binding domain-containing protein [Lachnospiraceae bacterium]
MKINIYYGGRGMIDDPTLSVLSVITGVLKELNVQVEQFNLYEDKNNITALPGTLRQADGIILASTVEWYGIGGYLMQFLDACWLYGDKEKISSLYMAPVVMSTTYGEREGKTNLESAWEILGGLVCSGICGYIADTQVLESSSEYRKLIEKNTENIYRTISQKYSCLPASNQAVKQKISIPRSADLTPQESEQLAHYVSDDNYVRKQKEDISELTDLFRGMMDKEQKAEEPDELLTQFENRFRPVAGVRAKYRIQFLDKPQAKPIYIAVDGMKCACDNNAADPADATLSLNADMLREIMGGRITFQRAFMEGNIKMKGDFTLLRNLDQIFTFKEQQGA